MEKTKEAVQKICELKRQFVQVMESEMAKGAKCVPTEEAGEVIDMIKDCAEAEEKLWKACYYKYIVEAMHESKEEEEHDGMPWYMRLFSPDMLERAGYDNWRYSSGRFAPKGHGHRSGYIPTVDPMMRDTERMDRDMTRMGRMGYPDDMHSPYGDSYGRWKDARRHYHETKSPTDKATMDEHAQKHMHDAMDAMRDIWTETDPELRKKMKTELTGFLNNLV